MLELLKQRGYNVLAITAANRDELEHTIEENFDANYDGEWKDDYDVLITTEVLAEGVNLHRAKCYSELWTTPMELHPLNAAYWTCKPVLAVKEPFVYVYNCI